MAGARAPPRGVVLLLTAWYGCLELSAAASYCPLPWNENASLPNGLDLTAKCPYGHRLPFFDVTVPHDGELTFTRKLCVFWGIMPFAVIGFGIVDSIVRGIGLGGIGTREFFLLLFVAIMVVGNELVMKRIIKEARPPTSCNFSCGFPSGHSVFSIGFFTLMFMDGIFRVKPRVPLDMESARVYNEAMKRSKQTFLGRTWQEWLIMDFRLLFSIVPLSATHSLGQTDFALFALLWGVILVPVPFSRVVLHDHTMEQVLVGSLVGMIEAVLYFSFVRHVVLPGMNHRLGKRIRCIFVHDHPLPLVEVTSRCMRMMSSTTDGVILDAAKREKFNRMDQELQWYIKQQENLMHSTHCWDFKEDFVIARWEVEKLHRMRETVLNILDNGAHMDLDEALVVRKAKDAILSEDDDDDVETEASEAEYAGLFRCGRC